MATVAQHFYSTRTQKAFRVITGAISNPRFCVLYQLRTPLELLTPRYFAVMLESTDYASA